MNENTKIEKFSPMPILEKRIAEVCKVPEGTMFSHIKYDESISDNYDYQIIRESTHDGTMLFTMELILEALQPIVSKTSYCKSNAPEDLSMVKDILYTIGDIKLESNFGKKEINGRTMHGQTDTVYLPVRVEYILNS